MARLGCELVQPFVDLLERDRSVDRRFADAEQVQVWTVQQQDVRHGPAVQAMEVDAV
jgi:hypothetical protein